MNSEISKILKMVAEAKISPEEGTKLIESIVSSEKSGTKVTSVNTKWNVAAIVSTFWGILALLIGRSVDIPDFVFLGQLLFLTAIITGHLQLRAIKKSENRLQGNGYSAIVLIIGYLGIIFSIYSYYNPSPVQSSSITPSLVESHPVQSSYPEPIKFDIVSAALEKQFRNILKENFIKIGKVTYDSNQASYYAELFYKLSEQEQRKVISLYRTYDEKMEAYKQPMEFQAKVPNELFGESSPGRTYYVEVDELLN
jgi:hypothetical protein